MIAQNKGEPSRTSVHFPPLSDSRAFVLTVLALGLDSDKYSITVVASKRGLAVKIGRLVIARGKNARELMLNFQTRNASKAAK